jgi:thiol-disulfide isomerase/thioredoxin
LHKVEVVSGTVLVLIGLAVAFNYTTRLSSLMAWLPNAESLIKVKTETPTASAANDKSAFKPAPDVELQTLDGKPFRLSELRGSVVLLNFWATWCGPCRAEIPEFNAMQREHASRGLKIIGVSSSDTSDDIKNFQKDVKQEYTVVIGSEDVPGKFGNGPGLPETLVIDREGRVRQRLVGGKDRETFEAAIKSLLDETSSSGNSD